MVCPWYAYSQTMISEVSPLPQMCVPRPPSPFPHSLHPSRTDVTGAQVPLLRALLGRGQDVGVYRPARVVRDHHRVGQQRQLPVRLSVHPVRPVSSSLPPLLSFFSPLSPSYVLFPCFLFCSVLLCSACFGPLLSHSPAPSFSRPLVFSFTFCPQSSLPNAEY